MKKTKRKIHTDAKGREYIKESYFAGGKRKVRKVFVIDGLPTDEFYKQNATDIDHLIGEEYWLISNEEESFDCGDEPNNLEPGSSDEKCKDLPF